jgi:hypothetical protein
LVPTYEYLYVSPVADWQLKSSSSFTSEYQEHNADCIKFHFHSSGYHFNPDPLTQKLCEATVGLEVNSKRIKYILMSRHQKASKIIIQYRYIYFRKWSRDKTVGIATGYGLDDRGVGVRVPLGSRIFVSPSRADRFWGPPNLPSNGNRRLFPLGKTAGSRS